MDLDASPADKLRRFRAALGRGGSRRIVRTRDKLWLTKVLKTAKERNYQPTTISPRDSQGPTPDKTMGNREQTRPAFSGHARTSHNTAKPKLT